MPLITPKPQLFTSNIYVVNVPIDEVSTNGQRLIRDFLSKAGFPFLPNDWDWNWKVTKGKYAGTLPKRISKYYYKKHQYKLSDFHITAIGNIASQNVFRQETFYIDFTNDFSWEAGDFGEDEGSCFWGCRKHAKDMILENGGQAIRLYRSSDKFSGYARAWILPSPQHKNASIIFNSYGLDLILITRLYAYFKGEIYTAAFVKNNSSTEKTLWVNGGKGYVSGQPNEICQINNYLSIDLCCREWVVCRFCCTGHPIENVSEYHGVHVCKSCVPKRYSKCEACNIMYLNTSLTLLDGATICYNCALSLGWKVCYSCGEYKKNTIKCRQRNSYDALSKYDICEDCLKDSITYTPIIQKTLSYIETDGCQSDGCRPNALYTDSF